jgi:GDPmannose 4,6-dehydratase
VVHDELSALFPQSPYAASKAAAHLLCGVYRKSYGIRVACGIVSNHESRRRPPAFLSAKIVAHLKALRGLPAAARDTAAPLRMGNLAARRDWGYGPDFVDAAVLVNRQIEVRARVACAAPDEDSAENYRDYVLGTGHLYSAWEMVDAAFRLEGLPLTWARDDPDPSTWHARFAGSGSLAVSIDPSLLRPSDPVAIGVDPGRARSELGWQPRVGLEVFLRDMLE